MAKDEEREKRLAEALRENLRKRKAQARGETLPASSLRRKSSAGADDHRTPAALPMERPPADSIDTESEE